MTWRKEPYPYTEEENEVYRKHWEKYLKAEALMKELNIPFEKITRYPFAFPDGMVSIMDLLDYLTKNK
jgi:hypothetical protein